MSDPIELVDALERPNVRPFLWALRKGEGTQGENGYRTLYGGGTFDSFADHPRRKVTAGRWTSTAAGAYQFLEKTWDGLVRQYGFADFSPANQDLGCVALIKGRRALDDVIAGRFDAAVQKCNKEWASLPGSPYGQPTVTLAQVRAEYEAAGGTYASTAPTLASTAPSLTTTQETPMAPFLLAALPALLNAAPELAKIIKGDGSKSEKAAQAAMEVAKQALGARNEQEVVDTIQADPNAAQAVRQAVQDNWFALAEVGGGIQAAREANLGAAKIPLDRNPAFILTLLILPLIYLVVSRVLWGDGFTAEIKIMVVTAVLSGLLGALTGFWWGSSAGSAKKDDALLKR